MAQKAIEQVRLNPSDWSARKLAVSILYDSKRHSEAAELLWEAPELPYKSQDIAFSIRVVAKHDPENAIRIFNEVVRRIGKNAESCLRLAKAFHNEGLPLLASRMYGAALAVGSDNFDIGFEQESLWYDDHGELVLEWKKQANEPQPNEPAPMKNFLGKAISFLEYTQKITECVRGAESDRAESASPKISIPPTLGPTKQMITQQPINATGPLLIPKAKPVDECK